VISGVITKEDSYWLTYSAANANAGVVGFFAGTGVSTPDVTGTAGTFTSGGLREFNFEGVEAGGGSLSAGSYNKTGTNKTLFTFGAATTASPLSASYTFTGSQQYSIDLVTINCGSACAILTVTPVDPATFDDGGNRWTIRPDANNLSAAPSVSGTFRFQPYHISTDLAPALGSPDPIPLDLDYPARTLSIDSANGTPSWDQANLQLTVTGVTFSEQSTNFVCDDQGAGICGIVPGPEVATTGDLTITFTDSTLTQYTGVAHTYQLANAVTHTGCIGQGGGDWCANGVLTFSGSVPSTQSVSQTLVTSYNAAYETTPTLSTVAGMFFGVDGVGTTLNSGATFGVDVNGTVLPSSVAENGQCLVSGTMLPHASGGNVYDVNLSFANNGGATCSYSGAFTGAATYDADTHTLNVTAVNAARDQGFLFSGVNNPI